MTRLAAAVVHAAILACAVSVMAQTSLSSPYRELIKDVRSACEVETRAAFFGDGYVKIEDQERFIADRAEQILKTSEGKDAAFMRRVAARIRAGATSAATRLNACVEEVLAQRRANVEVDPQIVADKDFAAGQRLIESYRSACGAKRDFEVRVLSLIALQGEAEYREDQRALNHAPALAAKFPKTPADVDSYVHCLFQQRMKDRPLIVKEFLAGCAAELGAWQKAMPADEYAKAQAGIEVYLGSLQASFAQAPTDTRTQIREDLDELGQRAPGTERQRAAAAVNTCMLKTAQRVFSGAAHPVGGFR